MNYISDLLELEMCYSLKIINLKHNQIEEEDNLAFLSDLNNLEYLNLSNNPIQIKYNYASLIDKYLAHVKKIE